MVWQRTECTIVWHTINDHMLCVRVYFHYLVFHYKSKKLSTAGPLNRPIQCFHLSKYVRHSSCGQEKSSSASSYRHRYWLHLETNIAYKCLERFTYTTLASCLHLMWHLYSFKMHIHSKNSISFDSNIYILGIFWYPPIFRVFGATMLSASRSR
jgi:hypothetical protein